MTVAQARPPRAAYTSGLLDNTGNASGARILWWEYQTQLYSLSGLPEHQHSHVRLLRLRQPSQPGPVPVPRPDRVCPPFSPFPSVPRSSCRGVGLSASIDVELPRRGRKEADDGIDRDIERPRCRPGAGLAALSADARAAASSSRSAARAAAGRRWGSECHQSASASFTAPTPPSPPPPVWPSSSATPPMLRRRKLVPRPKPPLKLPLRRYRFLRVLAGPAGLGRVPCTAARRATVSPSRFS